MASPTWRVWEVTDDAGNLQWLGASRPNARTALDRATVWTLIPHTRVFIANWFVSEAWAIEDSGLTFENVTSTYAQQIAPDVPQPSTEVIRRITHPERFLTLDQVTSYPAIKLLGKRADRILQERR